jgi:hypothetical protein
MKDREGLANSERLTFQQLTRMPRCALFQPLNVGVTYKKATNL